MDKVINGLNDTLNGCENSFACSSLSKFTDSKIDVKGDGNSIEILEKSNFKKFSITIIGNNNRVRIDKGVTLVGRVLIRGDGNSLVINESTTFQNTSINIQEGTKVEIGKDCMFASGVQVRTTDSHSILDMSGARINSAKDIIIGDQCWIGIEAFILKGTVLASGTVVGLRSVVAGKFNRANTVIAGVPAVVIKEGVKWDRKLL